MDEEMKLEFKKQHIETYKNGVDFWGDVCYNGKHELVIGGQKGGGNDQKIKDI